MSSTSSSLEAFKAAFGQISELPYCSGTVPLDENTAKLFYRSGDKADIVNFFNPTEVQLSSLAAACQQATFGVNQKDVLDESYRKAGKLDAADFSTQFSPLTTGIVDTVRESLLRAVHADKAIKVELYKLNVYGPGSFFKAHVDTPRNDTMFGSLVVVLPTAHKGGSLIFRHRGQERSFDTAHAVTSQVSPHIAFVAFFSDVEHEVSVVTSGYRVTLTYNLYFVDQPSPSFQALHGIAPDNIKDPLDEIKATLCALLADPEFLPNGGFLGFGLSHKYPFNPISTKLSELENRLNGSDASIRRVCQALSLNVSLKAVYRGESGNEKCLLDNFADLGDLSVDTPIFAWLKEVGSGYTYLYDFGGVPEYDERGGRYYAAVQVPIAWVKSLGDSNSFEQTYVAYGNEAALDYAYGEVCLVAKIAAAEKRNDM